MNREQNPVLADRLRGALWGLLVGDALGVPYEFHELSNLSKLRHLTMWSGSAI